MAEIPYGVLKRTACGNEEVCQRWCALQGAEGGLAVLNNGRYSYSAQNGEIRLTAANTSIYADHYGQQQRDAYCRYMDQGEMQFCYALVPYAGDWCEAGLHRRAVLLHQPLPSVVETYHKGPLTPAFCGIRLASENIRLGTLKRAENNKGYILRFAEAGGKPCSTNVELPLLNRILPLSFSAYEIKTLYIPDENHLPVREVLLTELDV